MPLSSLTNNRLGVALGSRGAGKEVGDILGGQNAIQQSVVSQTVTNTVAETNFDKTFTIKRNTLKIGSKIRVRAVVKAPSTNATDTLTVRLKIGAITIVTTGALDVNNNDIAVIDFDVHIRTIGAAGTMVAGGWVAIGAPGTITAKAQILDSTAIDTTVDNVVAISAQWSVANAGNQARLDLFNAEVIPPALAA